MCPDVDSAHHTVLAALGFTVPRLHALAGWPTDALQEALGRVLSGDSVAAVGCAPMTTFEAITFELAVRALPQVYNGLTPSLPLSLMLHFLDQRRRR